MSTVEDRIVQMRFENSQFQRGASQTMSMLDRLKAKLNFSGASKGLNDINAAAGKTNLQPLATSVEGVNSKFLALTTVAVTALSMITSRAIEAGAALASSFTVRPIIDGLQEYETNLNSIQTILANTGLEGEKGLGKVEKALDELNHYSDQTIYNFSEMARNIGTFTAAGVDLDTSTNAIKGIANLAAVSGSNSQQASTAMYQLSQALAAGKVSLMDWNSVVNAGMGGKVFQESLKETARVHGVAVDDIIKDAGSFRDSLQKGWITGEILTETLSKFTGDLSEAQLKTMGYNEEQIKGIVKMGQTATDAATKVKTMSQLISTIQESLTSGWAQSFELLFGDFNEARDLFTSINDVIGGAIGESAKARNSMISDWKELGGRQDLIDGLSNAFKALAQVFGVIKDAFREIFPATTGAQLAEITANFLKFTEGLKMGADTANDLKRTFAGVFAVFGIAWEVVKGLVGVIFDLVGVTGKASGGVLEFTGSLGDFLVALHDAIKNGGLLNGFFEALGAVLALPIKLLGGLGELLSGLFSGFDTDKADQATGALDRFHSRIEDAGSLWNGFVRMLQRVQEFLTPFFEGLVEAFGGLGDALVEGLGSGEFSGVLDAINTGLFAALTLLFKKFLDDGIGLNIGGDIAEGIADTFGTLTDTLKAMQTQIQAKTLLLIAGAVAVLTASVVALSMIDSKKLQKALIALTVGFAQLLVAMAILTKIAGSGGFLILPVLAGSMILLSTAVLILTAAVKNLSSLSWEELLKGLAGVAALLLGIVGLSVGLQGAAGGMMRVGLAMIPLATGIYILSSAVKNFGSMSWNDLVKGLVGMAGALGLIAGALYLFPPHMLAQAASLVLIGVALKSIGNVMKSLSALSWEEIAKGLVGVGGSLAIIAGAMYLFPPHMLAISAGLIAVGVALGSISDAVIAMAALSWEEIAKGLVALGGSLLILAGGLYLMSGALGGAAALVVAAGALAILAPVLAALGEMEWMEIVKGLAALAGVFAVLGAAGYLLAPVTIVILGLGAAVALLGAGVALLGAGVLALTTAFSILVATGAAGVGVMTAYLVAMIGLIPAALKSFGEGIVAFANAIGNGTVAFTKAFSAIITAILNAIIKATPKVGQLMMVLMQTLLKVIRANTPAVINTAIFLILSMLSAMGKHVGKMADLATTFMVRFMNALGRNAPKLANAGADLIIDLVNAIARTIDSRSDELGRAGGRLGVAIVKGMAKGILGGQSEVIGAAVDMASGALSAAKNFLGIESPSKEFFAVGKFSSEGAALGMKAYAPMVEKAAEEVGRGALDTIRMTMSRVGDEMSTTVDMDPTITPVLDLAQLTKDASQIAQLLGVDSISASVSFGQASDISSNRDPFDDEPPTPPTPPPAPTFIQNNNSPKALSEIDIYRNTKNLLSTLKE